ncbi:TIGR04222 domain-containing membrane protein [Amycolatopsis cihanbeyliensis]|uniref:Uncharacterized protein (TIGR04222 family) n=1 Tax=Amycolatopsis cihanbeyliensis TaxID=1128664 RepID=A0A542CUR5_AMYCI|nr:TIGR04222 domain-containing membrane protein [Amycolatopsis cihanbeyliensis]TQI94559.1 uncharacterized protein (TIGR04222 family) [Amycolatopsis cihanbeyliensis]
MAMTGAAAVWIVLGLLLLAALLRGLPLSTATRSELSPSEVGFLRGGAKHAVRAALASLDAKELIEPHPRGGIRRTQHSSTPIEEPFEQAVYTAVYGRIGPRGLRRSNRVRRALTVLERRLVAAGLVPARWRWTASRIALAAVPVVAVLGWLVGDARAWSLLLLALAALMAALVWWLPRRTIVGSQALSAWNRDHRGGPLPARYQDPQHETPGGGTGGGTGAGGTGGDTGAGDSSND